MNANANLGKAKRIKNDEFYTRLEDIENELKNYRKYLNGKVVYCNCDDPYISSFFSYFSKNFEFLGLKKLITTCYRSQSIDLFSQCNSDRAIKLEYEGGAINSLPTADDIGVTELTGDGDFRSNECISLLEEADIVVTNPPFSLFREYVQQLIQHEKKFIIIGSKNAIVYKEIFPLIKNNQLWMGHGFRNGNAFFRVSHDTEYADGVYDKTSGLVKFRNVNWYTNIDHKKRHEELILVEKFKGNESAYPRYDNYDAIEVGKLKNIPLDYPGVMGVPVTFLDVFNPSQFEILGANRGVNQDPAGIYGKGSYINGKEVFKRIFIRNLHPKEQF